jgi:DDE superfamily endonuclease
MGKLIRAVLRGQDDGNIIPLPDHQSKDLKLPGNMRLIAQPAYSPELNPVEHIWDELREKYFHNRIFSSLELLIDVLCQGLNALADDPDRILLPKAVYAYRHRQTIVLDCCRRKSKHDERTRARVRRCSCYV